MNTIRNLFSHLYVQIGVITLTIVVASLWLLFAEKSVFAFLMILFSLLIIYYSDKIPLKIRLAIGFLVLVAVMPAVAGGNSYYMEVATQVGIFIALGLGLNIVVGFAGLLDLGYIAFFAVGAYTYGIFATKQANNFMPDWLTFPVDGGWFWLFIVIGLIMAAIFGILLGLPVLKVRGDYLAIVTLGFGEIVRIIFNNLNKPINITNGPQGLTPIQQPELFGLTLKTSFAYYFIALGAVFIIVMVNRRLEYSRLGRAWVAVREDELAAQAQGIPLVRTKLLAFAIGASFAGVVGVIFAAKQTYVDPTSFTLIQSFMVLVIVVLGGLGSVPGVILGAAVVTILNAQVLKELSNFFNELRAAGILSLPSQLDPSKAQRFIFGILLIVMALYRSQGLIPAKRHQYDLKEIERLASKRPSGILKGGNRDESLSS